MFLLSTLSHFKLTPEWMVLQAERGSDTAWTPQRDEISNCDWKIGYSSCETDFKIFEGDTGAQWTTFEK